MDFEEESRIAYLQYLFTLFLILLVSVRPGVLYRAILRVSR